MLVSLLMPLLVAGVVPADSAPAAVPADAVTAAAAFADPPVRIDLNERVYRPGERARVRIRADEDGYLLVFQVDVDGHLRVLFPLDPFDDSYVRGDRRIELDGRGDRETFIVEANEGQGWIYAAWSRMPFQVERFALGDHWDYNRLSPQRLPESPEPELTELVRGIARASFDFDILPYTVARDRRVATTVVHRYDPFWDDCFGCGYYGPRYGSSITIRIGGSRYYDCWDAFWCDPYYYDPYYYRPRYVYYAPRYYRPYYYRPYYHRPYYRPPVVYRPRFAGRPLPPQFGDGVPYRDRRYDGGTGIRLVSDNTVYSPPPRRAAGGLAETPARRQIEESPGYELGPLTPGRRSDADRPEPSRESREPAARPSERPGRSDDAPGRRSDADRERPADRPAESGGEARQPERRAEPRAAEPRRSEPRAAEPRSAEPRSAEPRAAEPRSSEPRRRDAGPSQREGDGPEEIEARPSRPREERSAPPARAGTDERSRSDDRARSADRSRSEPPPRAQQAPERRSSPQPQARSGGGGGERSSGGTARSGGGSSGGSRAAPSGGGGRRRSP